MVAYYNKIKSEHKNFQITILDDVSLFSTKIKVDDNKSYLKKNFKTLQPHRHFERRTSQYGSRRNSSH